VTARGDRWEDIFWDDEDRSSWIANFAEVCQRFHWRCHAYCLTSNYYHIVVETPEANLSKGMRQLNGVFDDRREAMAQAYLSGSCTIREIAGHFRVH
jgi:putative transposase